MDLKVENGSMKRNTPAFGIMSGMEKYKGKTFHTEITAPGLLKGPPMPRRLKHPIIT